MAVGGEVPSSVAQSTDAGALIGLPNPLVTHAFRAALPSETVVAVTATDVRLLSVSATLVGRAV